MVALNVTALPQQYVYVCAQFTHFACECEDVILYGISLTVRRMNLTSHIHPNQFAYGYFFY
jgi:hypothetical protein